MKRPRDSGNNGLVARARVQAPFNSHLGVRNASDSPDQELELLYGNGSALPEDWTCLIGVSSSRRDARN